MSISIVLERDDRLDRTTSLEVQVIGGVLLVTASLRAGDELVVRTPHRLLGTERAVGDGPVTVAVPALILPRRFEVIVAVRRDGKPHRLASLAGTASVPVVASDAAVRPLLVAGLARGGTTLLMRLLREHPALLVVDAYPYEQRHAAVLFHQLLATAAPGLGSVALPAGSIGRSREPGPIGNPYFRPELPLFRFLATEHLAARARMTAELVDLLYREVGGQAGRPAATHFVEKFVGPVLTCAMDHCYGRTAELVLVRDARDAAVSQQSFNERRGFDGFGIGGDELVAVAQRIASAHLQQYNDRVASRPDQVALIRYEDLVRDPVATLDAALGGLGLGVDGSVLGAMVEVALGDVEMQRSHMTSSSASASIGRWREVVDDAQAAALDDALEVFDRTYGYGRWAGGGTSA